LGNEFVRIHRRLSHDGNSEAGSATGGKRPPNYFRLRPDNWSYSVRFVVGGVPSPRIRRVYTKGAKFTKTDKQKPEI